MAKNTTGAPDSSGERQSRKEELRARKQAEQLKSIRIGAIIVGALLLLILLVAVVNEYIIGPQRSVATVGEQAITLQEWQGRVRFERAQRVISLDEQLEMFNNDVGLIQQFAGQTINELQSQNTELFAEAILNQMTRDVIVEQALAERGITVTEGDIDRRISEAFNYFGGASPTPVPEPEDTVVPTPSVTPIGAQAPVEEAPLPTDVEAASTPLPTPTPVSLESFQEEFGDLMDRYAALGVDESVYRGVVGGAIASERLVEALAAERELPEEDVHASALLLSYASEEAAQQALEAVQDSDFLTVWNTVRSAPDDVESEVEAPSATEILWQTNETVSARLGPAIAEALFESAVDEPTAVIEAAGADGEARFFVAMVTGREERPLSDAELRQRKLELFSGFVDARLSGVEIGQLWRSRVPSLPVLDPLYLQPPTPAPELPTPQAEPADE